ncbi:MAG: hypothetical protein K2M12_03200 [Muribaculaceae bacterium]|nr:hypothetical protein [Muribaculaceae bacterium]
MMLCLAPVRAYASGPYECYQKGLFALDLSVGTNIDLSSLSQEQKTVFEERPLSVFQIAMRPGYYFSRHWGAYVDLRFNLFRFNDTERLVDVLMPGLSKLKPALSLGGTYRYEHGPWQIQPRLGVGIVEYGHNRSKVKANGKETLQKRTGSMWSVDAGVSAAYRTSKVCSIFLDLSAVQPFTPARYSRTTTADGVTTRYKVDTYTWGRSMSISLGIRFQTSGK